MRGGPAQRSGLLSKPICQRTFRPPARTRRCARRRAPRCPGRRTRSWMSRAQWIARAGPSKVAKKPSPAVSFSFCPRQVESASLTRWLCLLDQLLPVAIAKTRLVIGGVDDVGEHDGREDRVRYHGLRLQAENPSIASSTRAVHGVDVDVAPHPALLGEHLDPGVRHQRRDELCLRVVLLAPSPTISSAGAWTLGRTPRMSVCHQMCSSASATSRVHAFRVSLRPPSDRFLRWPMAAAELLSGRLPRPRLSSRFPTP